MILCNDMLNFLATKTKFVEQAQAAVSASGLLRLIALAQEYFPAEQTKH